MKLEWPKDFDFVPVKGKLYGMDMYIAIPNKMIFTPQESPPTGPLVINGIDFEKRIADAKWDLEFRIRAAYPRYLINKMVWGHKIAMGSLFV